MFQVFLTGNNSEYFTLSPTAVQGRADIRMRVAMPLDYEHIRSYSFSVSFKLIVSVYVCVCVSERDCVVRVRGWVKFQHMERGPQATRLGVASIAMELN